MRDRIKSYVRETMKSYDVNDGKLAKELVSACYDEYEMQLSNGAGDPEECKAEAAEADKLLKSGIPMLAVSLGHQILALSQGGKTYKLKYGHRGGNQPVKETFGDRIFITSQNHGYAVDNNVIPAGAKLLYVNANDGTCEGLEYKNAVSVQFHPEECGGPLDTQFIIDNFIAKTEEK